MREIEKEIIFYDESGGGVTFSGGEPLLQPEFLSAILDQCREREIHTAVDTTGCVPTSTLRNLAGKIDLFLYDLKIIDERQHLRYTGASNRLALDNLRLLADMNKPAIIRFPFIPGITGLNDNIYAACRFLTELKTFRKVEILPYHRLGEDKYRRLKLEYQMTGVTPPTPSQVAEARKIFTSFHFETSIGG